MSDQPWVYAHENSRELPERPSLRHLKLEAKRRLAAGEFGSLHDAQLALAREHGLSSWTALKNRIAAAAAAAADEGPRHALTRVRWVVARFANADQPDWTRPGHSELGEHFTGHFLSRVPPSTVADTLGGVAARLRDDLVIVDAGELHLRAQIADLLVEAAVEPEPPHRLTALRVFPGAARVDDPRVARPPAQDIGPVPESVPGVVADAFGELGLVGLVAAGDWDGRDHTHARAADTGRTRRNGRNAPTVWAHTRGWADLDEVVPMGPGHRFPAYAVTKLITATAVLCLVARGKLDLDDRAGDRLRSLRLAKSDVTVRQLLSHTGGVDSPVPVWADAVPDPVELLGPVVRCSGRRGEFAYGDGGYGVLGQLIADLTDSSYAEAAGRLVLEPLGMADSWFPIADPAQGYHEAAHRVVSGYRLTEAGGFVPSPNRMHTLQAAGGLWSTAVDLVRFGSGWRSLLPAELAEEALRPQAARNDQGAQIGLGWLLHFPKHIVGHAGSGAGSATSLVQRTESDRTNVVHTNRSVSIEPVNARLLRLIA